MRFLLQRWAYGGVGFALPLAPKPFATQEEVSLRRKVARGQARITRDRAAVEASRAKLGSFESALVRLREGTGCADLRDAIATFNRYEAGRFRKLEACGDLMVELERLAADVERRRAGAIVAGTTFSAVQRERDTLEGAIIAATVGARARERECRVAAEAARVSIEAIKDTLQRTCIAVGVEATFDEMAAEEKRRAAVAPGTLSPAPPQASPPSPPPRARVGTIGLFRDDTVQRGEASSTAPHSQEMLPAVLSRWVGLLDARAIDITQRAAVDERESEGPTGRKVASGEAAVAAARLRGSLSPATASGKVRWLRAG